MSETRKYYLEDGLFPRKPKSDESGFSQMPHLYSQSHSALLNEIARRGVKHTDDKGRVYYTLPE